MDSKTCTRCNIEKNIEDFDKKYTQCKICNSERSLKRYYENKIKISYQKEIEYEKNKEKLLQKQNKWNTDFKELLRSYAELQNKLKALEEKN